MNSSDSWLQINLGDIYLLIYRFITCPSLSRLKAGNKKSEPVIKDKNTIKTVAESADLDTFLIVNIYKTASHDFFIFVIF